MRPARATRVGLLTLPLLGACRTAEHDFALGLAPVAVPEAGGGGRLSLEQRVGTTDSLALALELGAEIVPLDEEGPLGDQWKRANCGLVLRARDGLGPRLAFGITWVRTDAAVQGLEAFGDYGGAYLALGHSWRLAEGLATGPELIGAWVDSEGDRVGSGSFAAFAWRIALTF